MKNISLLKNFRFSGLSALASTLFLGLGCASVKDLREAQTCKVWHESAVGNEYADLEGGHAIVRRSCLFGTTGCDTKETWYESDKEIHMTGKLAPFSGKVGEFSKGKLALTPPGPFKFMRPDKITMSADSFVITTTAMGHSASETYFFNAKCTKEEAALGAVVLTYSN